MKMSAFWTIVLYVAVVVIVAWQCGYVKVPIK